jgi:GntR family transcriptional regulator
MSLPANDPRPPYLLAADALRQEITSGRLKPGDRLPSSRELKERLGIANATVHSALRVLRDEGLIYSVQGRGSYVRDQAADQAPGIGQEATPADSPSDDLRKLHALMLDMNEQIRELNERVTELEAKQQK